MNDKHTNNYLQAAKVPVYPLMFLYCMVTQRLDD